MKWLKVLITVISVLGLTASAATARSSVRLTVNLMVLGGTELGLVEDDNVNIAPSNAANTAGSSPTAQADPHILLNWASNVPHTSKITAELGTHYASPGITYQATLTRPTGSGGALTGKQTLSTDAVDMLISIGSEDCTGATITYTASSPEMNTLPTSEPVTVIWTIIDAGCSDQDGPYYLGRHYYVWEDF